VQLPREDREWHLLLLLLLRRRRPDGHQAHRPDHHQAHRREAQRAPALRRLPRRWPRWASAADRNTPPRAQQKVGEGTSNLDRANTAKMHFNTSLSLQGQPLEINKTENHRWAAGWDLLLPADRLGRRNGRGRR
jgi:hypothetical protein